MRTSERIVMAACALGLAGGCHKSPRGAGGASPTPTGSPSASPVARGPLAALATLGAELDRGFEALLTGKSPAEAFAPLPTNVDEADIVNQLRVAGVASFEPIALEFELGFPGHEVSLGVVLYPGAQPAVISFAVETIPGERGIALSQLPASARALGDTARDLLTAIRAGRCSDLPLLDAAWAKNHFDGMPRLDEAAGAIAAAGVEMAGRCGELSAASKVADPLVEVDDLDLIARDAQGKIIGQLRAALELRDGKLVVGIGEFKRF